MFKSKKKFKPDNRPTKKSPTAGTLQEMNKAPFPNGNNPSKKLVK